MRYGNCTKCCVFEVVFVTTEQLGVPAYLFFLGRQIVTPKKTDSASSGSLCFVVLFNGDAQMRFYLPNLACHSIIPPNRLRVFANPAFSINALALALRAPERQ